MVLYPGKTAGGGGTRDWAMQARGSGASIDEINTTYDNGNITIDHTNYSYTFPDGHFSFTMSTTAPFRKTYTFIDAGYYNVDGIWSYKNAGETYVTPNSGSYCFWFKDLKRP